jgi:hypothetical protein
MTDIAECTPAVDEIEAFLAGVGDEQFDDSLWVDAEFAAIIAANWDIEPPDPPTPPTVLPARWGRSGRPVGPRSEHQRPTEQVMAGDHHRRQRSPPHHG